jgi:hypothetical protein
MAGVTRKPKPTNCLALLKANKETKCMAGVTSLQHRELTPLQFQHKAGLPRGSAEKNKLVMMRAED